MEDRADIKGWTIPSLHCFKTAPRHFKIRPFFTHSHPKLLRTFAPTADSFSSLLFLKMLQCIPRCLTPAVKLNRLTYSNALTILDSVYSIYRLRSTSSNIHSGPLPLYKLKTVQWITAENSLRNRVPSHNVIARPPYSHYYWDISFSITGSQWPFIL
jgi:hypothetical protein